MSGAGKSYVGAYVAKAFDLQFVDIDQEMEKRYGKPLQDILDQLGEAKFLEEQAGQIKDLQGRDNLVISPGGSVVYSIDAIKWLVANSVVVYLSVPFETIENRIAADVRGIVGLSEKSLCDLYEERRMLYESYAHHIIVADSKTPEIITRELRDILNIIS